MVKNRVAPYRPSYVVPAEWRLEVVEAVADGAERGLVWPAEPLLRWRMRPWPPSWGENGQGVSSEKGWPYWPPSKMFNNNNMFKPLTLGRWPTLSLRVERGLL